MQTLREFVRPRLLVILVGSVYVVSRLWHLTILPIITDEAIYLRWAQIIARDTGQLFIPLTDGKTPLFMWAVIPFLHIFADPLFAGRLFAIFLGGIGLVGIWMLAKILFGQRAAWYSAILWLITPYIYTYDRLALVESMLLTFQVWFLVMLALFGKKRLLAYAAAAGMLWGAALLTKPSAVIFGSTIPLFLLLAEVRRRPMQLILGFVLVSVIAIGMLGSLKVSPHFRAVFERTADYTYPWYEFSRRPWEIIAGNLGSLIPWLLVNATWPIVLWFVVGALEGLRKTYRSALPLVLLVVGFFGIFAVTGKVLYPRYLLGILPGLIPLAGLGIARASHIMPRLLFPVVLSASLVPALQFDWSLATKPEAAPLVHVDRWQYLSSWAAGHGIKAYADRFVELSEGQSILVGAEGRFGNPYNGLQVYLDRYRHIDVVAVDLELAQVPARLKNQRVPTYLVANQSRLILLPSAPVKRLEFTSKPLLDSKTPQDGLWLLEVTSRE